MVSPLRKEWSLSRGKNIPYGPFWHGSFDKIEGDRIIPRSERFGMERGDIPTTPIAGDSDRVYFTTSLEYAKAWVWRGADSYVYQVIPYGEVEDDPDTPGIGFSCDQYLRVVNVAEHPVSMTTAFARRAFASTDMSRFNEDGSINIDHPGMEWRRELGLTDRQIQAMNLPPFSPPDHIAMDSRTGRFTFIDNDVDYTIAMAMYSLVSEAGEDQSEVERFLDDNCEVISELVKQRPPGWV